MSNSLDIPVEHSLVIIFDIHPWLSSKGKFVYKKYDHFFQLEINGISKTFVEKKTMKWMKSSLQSENWIYDFYLCFPNCSNMKGLWQEHYQLFLYLCMYACAMRGALFCHCSISACDCGNSTLMFQPCLLGVVFRQCAEVQWCPLRQVKVSLKIQKRSVWTFNQLYQYFVRTSFF